MMENCIFCNLKNRAHVFDTEDFFGVWDIDPIQEGHLLVIAKNHIMNITEFSEKELNELIHIQRDLVASFEKLESVFAVTTIYNNGSAMMEGTHFHCHFIPRYKEDGFWDHQQVKQEAFDTESFLKGLDL